MLWNDDVTIRKEHQEDMLDLLLKISGYGSLDVRRCMEVLNSTDFDYWDFAKELENFCDGSDLKINKIDIVGFSYDLILHKVSAEILEKTKCDIFEFGDFEVYWDYYCTSYGFTDTEFRKINSCL